MKRRKDKIRIFELQLQALAAKASEAIITLAILRDVFDAEDSLLKQYYEKFKQETAKYNIWTDTGLQKAKEDFQKVAKTYQVKILPAPSSMADHPDRERLEFGIKCERTCIYITLRMLRENVGFTYQMLDQFIDSYVDFGHVYEDGDQVDMEELSDELEEIIGVNIIKGVKHGH